jgi:hypothetical protein
VLRLKASCFSASAWVFCYRFRSTDQLRNGVAQGALIVVGERTELFAHELGLDGENEWLDDAGDNKPSRLGITDRDIAEPG